MNTTQAFRIFVDALTATRHLSGDSARVDVGSITFRRWQRHTDGQTSLHDEALAQACPPELVLQSLQTYQPAKEHFITVLDDQPDARTAYEQAGYICTVTEYLMVLNLANMPTDAPSHFVQVAMPDDVARLNANDVEKRPWVWPQSVTHPAMRHYYIWQDERVVARAFSWRCDADTSYVSHVFTNPAYRRRGLGRAIMQRLLEDCAARGERWSVLVASEEGEALYRGLSYETLGRILIFEPAAR